MERFVLGLMIGIPGFLFLVICLGVCAAVKSENRRHEEECCREIVVSHTNCDPRPIPEFCHQTTHHCHSDDDAAEAAEAAGIALLCCFAVVSAATDN
ncbi:hypothetical protein L596_021360 [Steinernema carpocapsae]|uniref:Uncharacterized protein n=1 Tax=Steinernema carpocapsae TaxID=34508 RepID=A0A4U5MIK2_STECR|nr:hypothetical protein L596_021360 [Steinernema carpocapsae]